MQLLPTRILPLLLVAWSVALLLGETANADTPPFFIRPLHSLSCLDVRNASQSAGERIQQYACNGGLHQTFRLRAMDDELNGRYQLVPEHSGLCVASGEERIVPHNGTPITQEECSSIFYDNRWEVVPIEGGVNLVMKTYGGNPQLSEYCLDVIGGPLATADGIDLQLFDCLGGLQTNQVFDIVQRTSLIKPVHTGKCLDVAGASMTPGATIQQFDCNGFTQQVWRLEPQASGDYLIRSNHSNLCLASSAPHLPGTPVVQQVCDAGDVSMRWLLEPIVGGQQIISALGTPHGPDCLDVTGNSPNDGAPLQVYPCQGAAQTNQIFTTLHLCEPGWQGPACAIGDCSGASNCSGRGFCAGPNQCDCDDGWVGSACETPDCSDVNSCSGNGTCVDPNLCSCAPGWTGRRCEVQDDPCLQDGDGDGAHDFEDNCPLVANPSQIDSDGDSFGDACDTSDCTGCLSDSDLDGTLINDDNCPGISNVEQVDSDADGIGDRCESDCDANGYVDDFETCPAYAGSGLWDDDGDGINDPCDVCPGIANPEQSPDACVEDPEGTVWRIGFHNITASQCSAGSPRDGGYCEYQTSNSGYSLSQECGGTCEWGPRDGLDCLTHQDCPDGSCRDEYSCVPTQLTEDPHYAWAGCSGCTSASGNNYENPWDLPDGSGQCLFLPPVDSSDSSIEMLFSPNTVEGVSCCPWELSDSSCAQNCSLQQGVAIFKWDATGLLPTSELDRVDNDFNDVPDICERTEPPDSSDQDQDGIPRYLDTCPTAYDPTNLDSNGNGYGDSCDPYPAPEPVGALPIAIGWLALLVHQRSTRIPPAGRGPRVRFGTAAAFPSPKAD